MSKPPATYPEFRARPATCTGATVGTKYEPPNPSELMRFWIQVTQMCTVLKRTEREKYSTGRSRICVHVLDCLYAVFMCSPVSCVEAGLLLGCGEETILFCTAFSPMSRNKTGIYEYRNKSCVAGNRGQLTSGISQGSSIWRPDNYFLRPSFFFQPVRAFFYHL